MAVRIGNADQKPHETAPKPAFLNRFVTKNRVLKQHSRDKLNAYKVSIIVKGMLKMSRKIAFAAIIAAGFTTASFAEDKTGSNTMDDAQGASGPVAQLAMAQDLYAYGVENRDAMAVLTAARITGSVGTEDVERDMKNMPTEGADQTEDGEGVDHPVDMAMMLGTARELAAGNDALLGLVADAEAESSRGRVGGASRTLSRLKAGRTDVFTVPFYGGRLAELAIVGDGDADLDLLVTDANGNTICLDRSYSDKLYCSWTPAWDGYFHIAVKNMGRIRNSYYILTN